MQKRKNIDMLRFYGGDVRERTDDGVLIDTCKDDLWSDKTAYRTLNRIYDNIIDIYKLIDKTHRDIFQPKNLNN